MRTFRQTLLELLDDYLHLQVFLNKMNAVSWVFYEREKDQILTANRKYLRELKELLDERISDLRKDYRVTARNKLIKDIATAALNEKEGNHTAVRKDLLLEYSEAYGFDQEAFLSLPRHSWIKIDDGRNRLNNYTLNGLLLEEASYTNLAFLFNIAKEFSDKHRHNLGVRQARKYRALNQSTIVMAYSFVESFLNGIAWHILLDRKRSLTEEQEVLLKEWDKRTNKYVYLSLEEKTLEYQKIALGAQHPPINKGNCKDLKSLIASKYYRDALVHPTGKREPLKARVSIEEQLFQTSFTDVEKLTDCAVEFCLLLSEKLHHVTAADKWLHRRRADGFFPEEALTGEDTETVGSVKSFS